MSSSAQRLGFFLALAASVIMLLGILRTDPLTGVPFLTVRQAYINLAVAVVVSLLLVWPFPRLVETCNGILRLSAPATGVFAAVRGLWTLVVPLLLLGIVCHLWVIGAQRLAEWRSGTGDSQGSSKPRE